MTKLDWNRTRSTANDEQTSRPSTKGLFEVEERDRAGRVKTPAVKPGSDPDIRKCRACGHALFWCVTSSGTKKPVNPMPVADGNVIVEPASDPRLPPTAIMLNSLSTPEERKRALWKSHFSTCSSADAFRKGPR